MSRPIKFRVWDKDTASYVSSVSELYIDILEVGTKTFCLAKMCPGRYIIEQYTGLKDKNGKEIYEGDILWWEHFYGMTGENIETTAGVYWEEEDASFVVGDWFEPLGHLIDEDEVEVIGNIHEPPKDFRPEHLKRMGVTMVKGGE